MAGLSYFGNMEMDPTKPIFVRTLRLLTLFALSHCTSSLQNIDPMFVYGAATLGCAGMLPAVPRVTASV